MAEEIKANILLVDDEEQFLNVFSKRLEGRGMKVDTAATGDEAMKKAEGKDFDAIVLDLVMPGIDGIQALKRLREENPDLQIIILTGHSSVEKGVEAIKAGAVDFLEKPVDMEKLMKIIGEAQSKKVLLVEKKAEKQVKEILESKGW
ncbi:MAG: response regulator [Nitrospirae bacterium]|nr:response regulator [Nitrospirota bacterium]